MREVYEKLAQTVLELTEDDDAGKYAESVG